MRADIVSATVNSEVPASREDIVSTGNLPAENEGIVTLLRLDVIDIEIFLAKRSETVSLQAGSSK